MNTTTNGGADSRVSIPATARKAIQDLKKTLGSKHTDEFLYTTLKDCNMDPNEAGRRLKMIHDIREIAGKHSVDDVYTMLKECNMDPNEAAQRLLYIDTFHEVKKKHDRRKPISNDTSEEYRQTRGYQWRGANDGRGTFYSSKAFDDAGGGRNISSGRENGVTKPFDRVSKPTLPVPSGKEDKIVHVANPDANVNGTPAISNGSYSYKLAAERFADVPSSTSHPAVVSSQNTKHMCAVGTIKCEIVKRSSSSKANGGIPAKMKFSADQVGANIIPVTAEAADSYTTSEVESVVVGKKKISESIQNSSHVTDFNLDNQPSQLLNEPLKVTASEDLIVSTTKTHSVSEEESELKISAPKLDLVLEKMTISSRQPVIFPDHLQVPDNYKSLFIFGSLDAPDDDSKPQSVIESGSLDAPDDVSKPQSGIESPHQNGDVVTESSSSNENVSPTAQEGEFQDPPLPHASENVLPSEDKISSDSALKHEDTKVEMIPPITGFQNPVLQPTREYSFGYMPHLISPHFVQLDVPELQSGSTVVASAMGPTPATQPATMAMAGQGSMAMSPPLFPYFRQYPNYIPYHPYFHHMYLPQNAHLLNHGVFPLQPVPAPAGVKFHAPSQSQYKQGNDEDLTATQQKDNNIHSTVQQGPDEPQVWAQAAARDQPNLLPNYFYNFPQGHPMAAFSPLQPLVYQPQPNGETVEPVVQPQPQPQIN